MQFLQGREKLVQIIMGCINEAGGGVGSEPVRDF